MNNEQGLMINDDEQLTSVVDQWTMIDEQWTRINDQYKMKDEQWKRINDQWTMNRTMKNEL